MQSIDLIETHAYLTREDKVSQKKKKKEKKRRK